MNLEGVRVVSGKHNNRIAIPDSVIQECFCPNQFRSIADQSPKARDQCLKRSNFSVTARRDRPHRLIWDANSNFNTIGPGNHLRNEVSVSDPNASEKCGALK
jgi:hypothetical protein